MIIFNDGRDGVGEHQTENLVLQNHAIYDHNGIIGTHTAIDVVNNDNKITITQRTIEAAGHITLYNIQGILVAQGNNNVAAPTAGIYIVLHNGNATKVAIK